MTGVVFIVCVPTEDLEKQLKTKARKRVFIKENRNIVYTPTKADNLDTIKAETVKSGESTSQPANLSGIEGHLEWSSNKSEYDYVSMHKLVRDILKKFNIEKTAWSHNVDENYVQIIFSTEAGERCEDILEILREHSIGERYDSTISVIPCSLYYQGCDNVEETFVLNNVATKKDIRDTAWTRFVSSVRARLTVAQIVEVLRADAAITFDFMCLLVIATILCAIGLVENSNVYLLSSMLISPMMGPVMAGTFGTVIRDRALQKTGVLSELIALGIATIVGFCYGVIICVCTDKYGEGDWPTNEMITRGEVRTLGVGCLIALLSGAAVAVGVLSDNIASLVGVAISTSLMPPAVNAGLLWSLASVYYIKGNETTRYVSLSYTEYYSTERGIELASLGGVSLCLTFVNIICIYVAGILVFKIKEVAPMSSKDQARKLFWKHDIKIARDYNKTLQREEASNIQKQLQNEIAGHETHARNKHDHFHFSSDFSQDNANLNISKSQNTWSPCTYVSKRPSIQELQDLYANLLRENKQSSVSPINNIHSLATRNHSKYKRLSQIFTAGNDIIGSSVPQEPLELIHEVTVHNENDQDVSSKSRTPKKKFIVTPCVDILKNV